METRFEHFGRTDLGQRLIALIDTPDRYTEFRALSEKGLPAVTALVLVLSPVLMPLEQTDLKRLNAAKQFVGRYVGTIMRKYGHTIVRPSASVPGKLFDVAAVWSSAPSSDAEEDTQAD